MSSGDGGPYCPVCGEPVSATASYCMHCYEDLPAGGDDSDGDDSDGDDSGGDEDGGSSDPGSSFGAASGEGTSEATAETTTGEATDWTDSDGSGSSGSSGDPVDASQALSEAADGVTDQVSDGPLLDPEGIADNVLTVLVAIVGSVVIGFVGFFVLVVLTESAWSLPVGILAWLGGLAYLARQYSVQQTVAKTFYGVAAVLLAVPLMSLSPGLNEPIGDRAALFGVLLLTVAVPALVSAGIGYALLSFAPEAD